MLSQQELDARIKAANDRFVTGEDVLNAPPDPNGSPEETRAIGSGKEPAPWLPIDIYQNDRRKQILNAKKDFPRGSRAVVLAATEAVIDGGNGPEGLAHAKKRAEDDCESLAANGYKDRAALRKQQYMEEKFLPAVEVVIDHSSPDELLNCKEALNALDDMAVGTGSMKGYTAAYVRQAYGDVLGKQRGASDPIVSAELKRIKSLVAQDQIRTAIGIAQKLKRKIDDGEAMAEPEDYAVIGRIVAYAS